VPWAKVGPGWELVQFTTAAPPDSPVRKAPTELYLIGPSGARFLLYTWPKSVTAPYLVAWSGDKTRALLEYPATGKVGQLTLTTGKLSTFFMTGHATPIGYTRPNGLSILGWQESGGFTRLARYSLSGTLLKVLGSGRGGYYQQAVYSSDGTTLAVGDSKGLLLVSNRGGIIRQLPIHGVSLVGCRPARWWSAGTVLASCNTTKNPASRLWLVPVNGQAPVALTPQRAANSPDLGDMDAWRLAGGLYLQAAGGCGSLQIFRQAANGSITPVSVPQTTGNDYWVVTVNGDRMLLRAQTGCPGSMSLLWFNPRTHAEQWLLRTPASQAGVETVVPFYSREASTL
jgi:TolB protein